MKARLPVIAIVAVFALLVPSAPALAAPTWGIEMSHANAYGLQAGECPGGKEVYIPGEPQKDCGVDPYTGSGTTFARESGFNTYTIRVKNTASGGSAESLTCQPGSWEGEPTAFEYRWLRNGETIAGAEAPEYTTTKADEGAALQCEAIGTNAGGAAAAASTGAVLAPPPPATTPPLDTGEEGFPFLEVAGEKEAEVGNTLICNPNPTAWSGSPTFAVRWLRNGATIAGATGDTYQLVGADEGTDVQCQVIASNAGGSSAAFARGRTISPEPSSAPPAANERPTASAKAADEITGPMTVADRLPEGLVLAGSSGNPATSGSGWECVVLGVAGVTCTRSTPLAPGGSYPPIRLHVRVSGEAPVGGPPSGGVTDTAAVSGGGAATALASDPTTIAPAVPFGIQSFTTSVTESLGNPFTQAGGHPFAANATFIFNYGVELGGRLWTAGGIPKDVETELPPGFIGNPQSAATCTAVQIEAGVEPGERCPAGSAVGLVAVMLSGQAIEGGKANPFGGAPENTALVYNLDPSPGSPAAFGFVDQGAFFALNAKVRSDGDYGITIGDNHVGCGPTCSHGLLAVSLTFCSNGVTGHGTIFGGRPPTAACAPLSSGAKPFLTNPTRCEGPAPQTTLLADTYEDPTDYASKTVYTGTSLVGGAPSASESFATGCSDLQFGPEVEFKPGSAPEGGTNQADEPTGATFDLKVPQSSEAEPEKSATPELKDATVRLPAGMSIDPSAADGLQACSNVQFGLGSTVEPVVPEECPRGSQIGTMEIFEPLLSGAPKVTGVAEAGATLYCSNGVWNGSPGFSYRWLREGVPVVGATGGDYTLGAADEGKTVQCQVTVGNAGGGSVAVDRVADVIAPEPATAVSVPPANLPAPSGTPSVGGVLSCDAETGSWSAGPTFAYQWLRGGAPIPGATGSQYTLGGEDAGEAVQCEVIASTGGGMVVDDSAAVVIAPSPSVEPPMLGTPIHGKLFLGEPLCGEEGQSACGASDASSGRLFRLFLEANDPTDGVIIKIPGTVAADTTTGQLTATFRENPQLPFEELKLKLNGGPRAPLASPQTCGAATTSADLTPWSTSGLGGPSGTEPVAGTPDATPSSSVNVDWDGNGGACPSSLPFSPAFSAGMASTAAGAYSSLSVGFSREDREQDLSGITVHTPVGVLANLSGVPLCGEPLASQGTCAAGSQIGTTSAAVGPGQDPFWITDGRVYLTTGYNGAPFGLSIVVPADAGPFHLGNVVVRASIGIDPHTAAITVTSDPLPQIWDGVPLRLRSANVDVNRPGFMFNATSCASQQLTATITGAPPVNDPGEPAKSSSVSSAYGVGGCTSLPFKPVFSAATQGKTSKADGASLSVRVAQTHGEADIHSVRVELPKQLPSRLTTLQQACTEAQFATNPAGCPAGSVVGTATASTPVLPVSLTGPAYFVSHGGAKFPELIIVLQGDGVTIDLAGETFINGKTGVTSSTFSAVPDAPISSFELSLPTGPHSALAANANLCTSKLVMPTTVTGQNGAQLVQSTKITTTGCTAAKIKPLTRAQKLKRALHVCRTKYKKQQRKRQVCEKLAHRRYGPIKKTKKTNRKGK